MNPIRRGEQTILFNMKLQWVVGQKRQNNELGRG